MAERSVESPSCFSRPHPPGTPSPFRFSLFTRCEYDARMPGTHQRGRRPPTEHRVRVRRYAKLFNRGFAAIAICVLVAWYELLVLMQDLFGLPPRNQYLFRNRRDELSYRIHQVIVESGLRLARAAGMS